MAITTPRFYPAGWAADQQLPELTAEEMVTAFPTGLDQRPTRQTLNRALQYATNGIIYYLIHGVADWSAAVQYPTGGIVRFEDQFYRATMINANVQPPSNATIWEWLPWRKSALDAIYLTMEFGDAHFLTLADADERFYSRAQMDALFITQADMALIYVTQAALRAEYITRDQAESIFLTEALADVRYAIENETVTQAWLAQVLEAYLLSADAHDLFLTPQSGDATLLNLVQARATYLLQETAPEEFEAKDEAAISIYSPSRTYGYGVLAVEPIDTTWQVITSAYHPNTVTIDTTEANFLMVVLGHEGVAAIIDSENNEWVREIANAFLTIYYCIRPATSAQHTFTRTSGTFPTMVVVAFKTPPLIEFDQITTARDVVTGTTILLPSITPKPNSLVVTAATNYNLIVSVDTDFEMIVATGPSNYRVNVAYRIATNAASLAPTWTMNANPPYNAAAMLSFKPVELPTRIFRSLVENNLGNPLSDIAYWEPWTPPTTEAAPSTMDFIHGATYMEAGTYTLTTEDVANGASFGTLEGTLMRFRLKGGGGRGRNMGGGGEGGELSVVDVINPNRFPLTLTVGEASQPSFVTASNVEPVALMTPINCGAELLAVEGWDDRWYVGGFIDAPVPGVVVDTSRVERPAPQEVYQTSRHGNFNTRFTYTIPPDVATPGKVYRLRMHFAENWVPQGRAGVNVLVNGRLVKEHFAVADSAGGIYIAYILEVDVTAESVGLVISFTETNPTYYDPFLCGVELEAAPVLLMIEQGHDADANSPGTGGEAAIIPVTEDRSPLTSLVIPGSGGRFPWPGYRSADGGGVGGVSGWTLRQVNCGGGVFKSWGPDAGYGLEASLTYMVEGAVDTSRVLRPAPMEVYQSGRFISPPGTLNYNIPGLVPNTPHIVRLHFCENYNSAAGQRVMAYIRVNNVFVLGNFDIFAAAGGARIAYIHTVLSSADTLGRISFAFTAGIDAPQINGIEIFPATIIRERLVPIAINAGGLKIEYPQLWQADTLFFNPESKAAYVDLPVDLTGIIDPAPEYVYQTIRFMTNGQGSNSFTATIPVLSNRTYRVRLHFFNAWQTAPGMRLFHISINGRRVETDFDIFARAGGSYKALITEYLVDVGTGQQIVILFENHLLDAMVSGIEVIPTTPVPIPMGAPINCGNDLLGVSGWNDRWYVGGLTIAADWQVPIDTSKVKRPAPDTVYRTSRYGGLNPAVTPSPVYTIPPPTVTPGWVYHLRLHFCECWLGAPGRIFHVRVNGLYIVQNYDVVARTGGSFIADIIEADVSANAQGLVITFEQVAADAIISGIELELVGLPEGIPQAGMLGGGGNSYWDGTEQRGGDGFITVDW